MNDQWLARVMSLIVMRRVEEKTTIEINSPKRK